MLGGEEVSLLGTMGSGVVAVSYLFVVLVTSPTFVGVGSSLSFDFLLSQVYLDACFLGSASTISGENERNTLARHGRKLKCGPGTVPRPHKP